MIRRRYQRQETKTGHERWLVSYADFITLLFAFFVVMYSVSQVNADKYRVLSETLSTAFQGKAKTGAGQHTTPQHYPLDQQGRISGLSPAVNLMDTQRLAREIDHALITMMNLSEVTVTATEEWVRIALDANLLFQSARAEPSADARVIFAELASVLAPYSNAVEVAGHTDNVPISTSQFRSNWALSSARAASVVRLLADNGVGPERLSAVGYGEFRPVADNATEEGRAQNRSVVIMVARTPVQRPEVLPEQWQGDSAPEPETAPPQTATTPLQTPDSIASEPTTPEPTSTPSSPDMPESTDAQSIVEPVRLDGGGLLFRSDADSSDD